MTTERRRAIQPLKQDDAYQIKQKKQWTFDKTINIPSIIAILGVLISLGSWLTFQEHRTTVNEESNKTIKEMVAINEKLANRDRVEMREDIKDVKIDSRETKLLVLKLVERKGL